MNERHLQHEHTYSYKHELTCLFNSNMCHTPRCMDVCIVGCCSCHLSYEFFISHFANGPSLRFKLPDYNSTQFTYIATFHSICTHANILQHFRSVFGCFSLHLRIKKRRTLCKIAIKVWLAYLSKRQPQIQLLYSTWENLLLFFFYFDLEMAQSWKNIYKYFYF